MSRARWLQETRQMRFEDVFDKMMRQALDAIGFFHGGGRHSEQLLLRSGISSLH
jgi:hypothetical protein